MPIFSSLPEIVSTYHAKLVVTAPTADARRLVSPYRDLGLGSRRTPSERVL